MKKRMMIFAGLLSCSLLFAGCGKEEPPVEEVPEVTVTIAPAEPTQKPKNLVEMEKTDPNKKEDKEEEEKNVIGQKSETAEKLTIINRTGGEVNRIYIRPNTDDDDWGKELVETSFVLKETEQAVYYFEKGDEDALYDIRIGYSEEGRNECFFRKLPLNTIKQITLCMDGVGQAGIPYARYITGVNTPEVSTLEEVKRRLGLLYDDDDYGYQDEDYNKQPQQPEENTPIEDPAPETPEAPSIIPDVPEEEEENPMVAAAAGCIGRPLSALIAAVGEPNGTTYENEPETGETGYHYYDGFTVSTTVDENGNEIVAGVW
ncbi:MAG: hypothetical protein KBT01_07645 [Clostridiales bacterium]|nr:hypothetical protein [Candidatus Blautia equi]